jgi:hypothetical protein
VNRTCLQDINTACVVALTGHALAGNMALACVCYIIYAFIYLFRVRSALVGYAHTDESAPPRHQTETTGGHN